MTYYGLYEEIEIFEIAILKVCGRLLPMKKFLCLAALASFAPMGYGQQADLWSPKSQPANYVAPNKPHIKIAELKSKHNGQASWREVVVDDNMFRSEYIQSTPGTKMPRALHPDTRAWWIVVDGQIRFDIEGQESFVGSKGSIVQVPRQTLFSMETIGDKPALVLECNIAGATLMYAKQDDLPKMPKMIPTLVRFPRTPGEYGPDNKPHITWAALAKEIEEKKRRGSGIVVTDDRASATFIYGYEKNLPPAAPNDMGHYHPECSEFWLIMSGQISYRIEGISNLIVANEGDVVYAPRFTYHNPRFYGPGPSTRLAITAYTHSAHLYQPNGQSGPSGQ